MSNPAADCRTLLLSQYAILGLFGHHVLVMLDAAGQVVGELNGLATSRGGRIKPVGYLPCDRLKVHSFNRPYLFQSQQRQAVLVRGCREQVEPLWRAALAGAEAINARHLAYPILGLGKNSNSVASTLLACMGLAEPDVTPGLWAPGRGYCVLTEQTIAAIRAACSVRLSV